MSQRSWLTALNHMGHHCGDLDIIGLALIHCNSLVRPKVFQWFVLLLKGLRRSWSNQR